MQGIICDNEETDLTGGRPSGSTVRMLRVQQPDLELPSANDIRTDTLVL